MNGFLHWQFPLRSPPLGEPKEPGRDDDQKEGEDEESEQDQTISPSILVPDMQRDEEVLYNTSGQPTNGNIVGVVEISAKGGHKLVRPSATHLTLWWIEPGELLSVCFTVNLLGGLLVCMTALRSSQSKLLPAPE